MCLANNDVMVVSEVRDGSDARSAPGGNINATNVSDRYVAGRAEWSVWWN